MVEAIIVEILVAEEDYKYSLFDWDEHSEEIKAEILRDADASETHMDNFVWRERWLIPEDDDIHVQDWMIHELMGRDYKLLGEVND